MGIEDGVVFGEGDDLGGISRGFLINPCLAGVMLWGNGAVFGRDGNSTYGGCLTTPGSFSGFLINPCLGDPLA